MEKDPKELVRMTLEDVYGKGKTELIAEMFADDFREHDPLTGPRDKRGIEEAVRMYRGAFPDLSVQVIECVQAGDVVTARWRATGTHDGELLGLAPTHKCVEIEGITMAHFSDGQAREAWIQWDALGMMRALGAAPDLRPKRPDGAGEARAPR